MNEQIAQQVVAAEAVYAKTLKNINDDMPFRRAAQYALSDSGIGLADAGISNLPESGSFLLVGNHPSYLDPLIAAAAGVFERRPDIIIPTHLQMVDREHLPNMHEILNGDLARFWAIDNNSTHPYLGAAAEDIEQEVRNGAGLFDVAKVGLDWDKRHNPAERADLIAARAAKTESIIIPARIKLSKYENGDIYMAHIEIKQAAEVTSDTVRAAVEFAYSPEKKTA